MKKVLTLVVALLVSSIATNAQGVRFGVKGGVNFSNMSEKDIKTGEFINMPKGNNILGFEFNKKFLIGYNVGLTAGIDFHENFGFEGGLIFNTKGVKYSSSKEIKTAIINGKYDFTHKLDMLYLDIPLSIRGIYTIVPKVQVYGKFGPYVGIALMGKYKNNLTKDGKDIEDIRKALNYLGLKDLMERDVKFGEDINEYSRLDYGLQMGLGMDIGGFTIEGIYKFSLGDIEGSDIYNVKNHVIALSVGYNLKF